MPTASLPLTICPDGLSPACVFPVSSDQGTWVLYLSQYRPTSLRGGLECHLHPNTSTNRGPGSSRQPLGLSPSSQGDVTKAHNAVPTGRAASRLRGLGGRRESCPRRTPGSARLSQPHFSCGIPLPFSLLCIKIPNSCDLITSLVPIFHECQETGSQLQHAPAP